MKYILGIETSCDDTGIAIYSPSSGIVSNLLNSQTELHNKYGGIVPELAGREHIAHIGMMIEEVLQRNNLKIADIDLIAYTVGPGLVGSLLIGATVANSLACFANKPIIPIHHLEGHLLTPFITQKELLSKLKKSLVLLVSGGHTQLILTNGIGNYTLVGDTMDDSCGEAFDKIAKMLQGPYPGGHYIATLASKKQSHDFNYQLPRPMLDSKNFNFSFSGLKTAASLLIKQTELTENNKNAIAYATEEAIIDILIKKTAMALKHYQIDTLIVSGGVSANLKLRNNLKNTLTGIDIYYPQLELCSDNGAMIAFAGYVNHAKSHKNYNFNVFPRYNLYS